ncbi:type IV secretion system DNA-binding domain-containing protein [Acidithiobacillus ferrooxidans]|uniref:type IV secretion system DNA-binding domain-containing protein n=1 Tax=Acidithiobacillus ferrooxidans TaxID=920 RepID=UPI001C07D350|nr:type IV secretion system DNA-binding domain-containing protein [Acidithiobacillus ferrooxidans]MBU2857802.1 type IV secretion system DNA-binding domain-containing protein [Acidithiobacillus ferrooxidans]
MGILDFMKSDSMKPAIAMGKKIAQDIQQAGETPPATASTLSAADQKMLDAANHRRAAALAAFGPAQDQHLSGTRLHDVTRRKLKAGENQLVIAGVPIPEDTECQHFFLAGAPGTGKSQSIKGLLSTIRARNEKAICFDPVGDMVSTFYRPGIDIILNPLDSRDAGWYPWNDLERHELPGFCKAIIPDAQGGADPFWPTAAQAVLQSLFATQRTLDEVLWYGVGASDEELMALIKKAGKGGLVGQEKTFSGVRATLAAPLEKLSVLRSIEKADGESGFSIKRWVQNDDDKRWVFLLSKKDRLEALKPLFSLWLDMMARSAMSVEPSRERRIWCVIDELPTLSKIPALPSILAEGRKYGLSAILGLQNYPQLRETWGKDGAAVLLGLPRTRLILRVGDAETADEMSKELGEKKVLRTNHSSSQGASSSTSESQAIVTERAVLPSEIAQLPNMVGYLRAEEEVMRVKIDYVKYEETQPQHMDVPQRELPWENMED